MPMLLEGRRVWITGASSGIGAALAAEAAARGARLILSARRIERLREVAAACPGEEPLVLPLDLTDPAAIAAAADSALTRGPLDVLIHNAGVSQRARAEDTALEVDRRLMETNYFGAVALTKAVLPAMLERGAGHFVVVTSLVGHIGSPLRSGYAASKHALHGFFESLRAEVWGRGLRVTMACPGFIRTDLPLVALTGDGSPQGRMDRAQLAGMAPRRCAAAILTAVEAGREEVLVGGRERYAVLLERLFPSLFRRVIRRARVT